jgi:hypothetical protein
VSLKIFSAIDQGDLRGVRFPFLIRTLAARFFNINLKFLRFASHNSQIFGKEILKSLTHIALTRD